MLVLATLTVTVTVIAAIMKVMGGGGNWRSTEE